MSQQPFFDVLAKRLNKLERLDHRIFLALLILWALLIAWADYATDLLPFIHYYILPIAFSAYFLSRKTALLLAVLVSVLSSAVYYLIIEHLFSAATNKYLLLAQFAMTLILFVVIALVVNRFKQLLMQVKLLANVDSLTKASTRRYFYERCIIELARSYRYKHPVTIAFIDLDNFKEVNDTYGHEKGDQLLVKTASTIMSDLREGDLFGRLGGDEFAIFLPQADTEQAKKTISRLREKLLNEIKPFNTDVTFSIGVVTCVSATLPSFDDLLILADKAMYQIKRTTKDNISFVKV